MAVAVRGKTGLIVSSQASPATINNASYDVAPQPGDILILFTHGNNDNWISVQGAAVGTLSGWTLRASDQTSNFYSTAVWTRVATGSDDITSFPWTGDGGTAGVMLVVAMSGATYGGIGAFANRTTSGTLTIPTGGGSTGDVYVTGIQQVTAATTTTAPGTTIFSSTTAPIDANSVSHRALVTWETLGTPGTRTTGTAAGTTQGVIVLLNATATPATFVPQPARPTVRIPRAFRSVQSKIRVARLGPNSPSPVPAFSRSKRPPLLRRANMRVSSPRLIGKQTVNVPQVKLKRTLLPMRPRSLRSFKPPITPPSPTVRSFGTASQNLTAPNTGTVTITSASLTGGQAQTGDLLIAFVNFVDDNTATAYSPSLNTSAGWSFDANITDVANASLVVYTKRATGTTSDDFVLNWFGDTTGGDYRVVVHVLAIQNAGQRTIGAGLTGAGTSISLAAVGNTADLLLIASLTDLTSANPYTTPPSGMSTVVTGTATNSVTTVNTIVYSQAQVTPASKTVSVTLSSGVFFGIQIAIPYKVNLPTYPFVPQVKTKRPALPLRSRGLRSVKPTPVSTKPVPQVRTKRHVPPLKSRGIRVASPVSTAPAGFASIRGSANSINTDTFSGTVTVNASSLTPSAASSGDLLLAFVNVLDDSPGGAGFFTPTTPTGWTVGLSQIGGSSVDWVVVYKRTATGTPADNFVMPFSIDGSGQVVVNVVAVQNAGTPSFGNRALASGTTTLSVPAQGSTGDLLVLNVASWAGGTAAGTLSGTPSGTTSIFESVSVGAAIALDTWLSYVSNQTPGTHTVTAVTLATSIWGTAVSIPYAATVASATFIPQAKVSRKALPFKPRSLRTSTPVTATATVVAPTFIPQNTRIRTTPPRTTRRISVAIPVIPAPTYVPVPNRLRYVRPKPSPTRMRVSAPVQTQVVVTAPTFVPQSRTKRSAAPLKARSLRVFSPVPTTTASVAPTYVPFNKAKRVTSPFKPRSMRVAQPFLAGLQTVNVPQVKTKRVTSPFKPRSLRVATPVPQALVVAPTFVPQAKIKRSAVPAKPRSLRVSLPVISAKSFVPPSTRLRTPRPKPFVRRPVASPVFGQTLSVTVTDLAGVFDYRTNLAPNPSGETNTTGWTWQAQSSGDTATVAQNATSPLYGSQVIRASITASQTTTSNHGMQIGSSGTVSAGDTVTASVWVRPSRTNVFKFGLDFTGGGNSGTSVAVTCPAGVWTQINATGVAAAGTTGVIGNLWTNSASGSVFWQSGDTIDFDGLLIEKSATVGSYFDTTLPGVSFAFVSTTSVTDSAGVTDAASSTIINGAQATDDAGVSDTYVTSLARATAITDAGGLTDAATANLIKGVSLSDRTTMYDKVTTVLSHTKTGAVTDQSGVTDTTYAYLINRPHGSWGAPINRSHG